MSIAVSDRGSNKPEQIEHAAEVLGRSTQRTAVFKAIYTGKSSVKTVVQLMDTTGLVRTRVLDAGKCLADQDIVEQVTRTGLTGYKKISFFQRHRDKIIRLATDPQARGNLVTKRRPTVPNHAPQKKLAIAIRAPRKHIKASQITIDDVDSFKRVRRAVQARAYVRMPETQFKNAIAKILGEHGTFKDWGGESRDLFSTRLQVASRRRSTAFAFKGPGTTGRLTPGKMGKNGDQIQRLMRCPAQIFFVQYWAEIDDTVLEQLQKFAELRSYFEQKEILYGIIDGSDSGRLIASYPESFKKRATR